MGITNVDGHKERSNPQIRRGFERREQKDLTKAVSNPKDPRITTQTQRVSTRNFSGLGHGILPHQTYSPCLKHLHGNLTMGKYEYSHLPMGLCNSPNIFQEKMSELMKGLEFAQAYINDLLIISTRNCDQHLTHLGAVLSRLNECGLKADAPKSFFPRTQLEYLGYWITPGGVMPLYKNVKAINNLAPPRANHTDVRKFSLDSSTTTVTCERNIQRLWFL
jgi:hypothetical protein